MAKDRFISGQVVAIVSFNDRTDQYSVKLCPTKGERSCENVKVGLPGAGARSAHGKHISVDDPRALRNAVHAALSFSSDRIQDRAATNRRGSGWLVKPLTLKGRR
jgi:hypothetical protein